MLGNCEKKRFLQSRAVMIWHLGKVKFFSYGVWYY